MSDEKEPGSLIPYIDDGDAGDEDGSPQEQQQCNLTITRNYQNKTRRVEMSKTLQDVESLTHGSLSPVAPLASDGDAQPESDVEPSESGAEFELTIRNNNSVIRIQGFDMKSTISFDSAKGGNVYEVLSREVDKIFQRPDRAEIEKAMRSLSEMKTGHGCDKKEKKAKPVARQKKNSWKMMTKTIMSMRGGRHGKEQRRGSVERYPKMVLLQPEAKPKKEQEIYPKMVMLEEKDGTSQTRLESQKSEVKSQNREIEKSKSELRRERKTLMEEKKMLKDKRDAMAGKRVNAEDEASVDERFLKLEMDIIAEEKLCVELERKLLGEEKVMLQEEFDLLKKEKEMLMKERNLLGEEINALEEEKSNLERKKGGDQQRLCDDIDEVLRGTLKLDPSARKSRKSNEKHRKDNDEVAYSSAPPWFGHNSFHEPYHCPSVYIPVCNRPAPYYQCEFCCGGRTEAAGSQKNTTTQTTESALSDSQPPTDAEPSDARKDMELPFGLLSNFFPRIVVMKSFQEEVSGDETDAKIFEIPKSEDTAKNDKEGEKGCEESELLQGIHPQPDEVDSTPRAEDGGEGEEPEESPVGFDEGNGSERSEGSDLPLTKIGYRICDEVSALSEERKRGAVREEAGEGEESGHGHGSEVDSPSCNLAFQVSNKVVSLAVHDDNVNIRMRSPGEGRAIELNRKHVTHDKAIVRKSELWHPNGGDGDEAAAGSGVTLSISDGRNVCITVTVNEGRPGKATNEAKVGTDGFDLAGGDRTYGEARQLSPRTGRLLKSLQEKLERAEGSGERKDLKYPGLFFIKPFEAELQFPGSDRLMKKGPGTRKLTNPKTPVREYYCEECLATMRLFEDKAASVKNMIDKFETIIHLGSY